MKTKFDELETNSKMKNIRDFCRGINDFKKGQQARTDIVKVELIADCDNILARWRNHFSQLFNVHGVSGVMQAEIHTTEPLVPKPSAFEFETAI